METVLLKSPPVDQKEWIFNVWLDQLDLEPDQLQDAEQSGMIYGKRITFKESEITLKIGELPNNRILQEDDPSKFIALSFGGLRFPDTFLQTTGEYCQGRGHLSTQQRLP